MSPYTVLDIDAFSLLVTLLSTAGSLFTESDNTNSTKKFTILLGNSVDKNLIELVLTLHLVQVSVLGYTFEFSNFSSKSAVDSHQSQFGR
jgi:hypothetical protein